MLFLLHTASYAASSPLSTQIECSPNTLTGPTTVRVSINIANIGDDDLPGTVKILDPNGNVVASTQLLMQQSFPWQGEWKISQDEYTSGRFVYKVQYQGYDESGKLSTQTVNLNCKFTKKAAMPDLKVAVQLRPEKPVEGQSVTIDMIIRNVGSVNLENLYIVDKELGIAKNDLTHAQLKAGDQVTLSHSFVMGNKAVTSEPVCYFNIAGDAQKQLYMAYSDGKYVFEPAKVDIVAQLSADKQAVKKGEKVELTCVITNKGNLSYDSIAISDATLGQVAKSVSVGADKTVTEKRMVEIYATTAFQFTLTGSDSSGNPLSIKTNEITVQTEDDVKPASLRVTIEGNRDVMYEERSTGIFMVKVENTGTDTVQNIDIYADKDGKTKIQSIPSIPAGQEVTFAKEFTLSVGGKYQFFARTKDVLSGQDVVFESNIHQVTYQPPVPTPSPTPTLTHTPSPTPTPEPTLSAQLETTGESGGLGRILLYILAVLLVVIIGGVVAMFVLDRYRGTPSPSGPSRPRGNGQGSGSIQVIDRFERGARRDYARAPSPPKRGGRSSVKRPAPARKKVPDAAQTDAPALPQAKQKAEQSKERVFATLDVDAAAQEKSDWAPEVELMEPELPESGFAQGVDSTDSHLVPPEKYQRPSEPAASPFQRPAREPEDIQDRFDDVEAMRKETMQNVAPEDTAMRAGSDGQYHLSRRKGSMRPKTVDVPRVEAEDPANFARKQRSRRGREMNMAQFYEDEEDGAETVERRRRRSDQSGKGEG
ncbi:MAG TPA: hypothetical protein PKE04_09945 [Clostridia bacterium]|nr:hypothetical protein [Clostridia bacterium]